jgi:hypothetical protein
MAPQFNTLLLQLPPDIFDAPISLLRLAILIAGAGVFLVVLARRGPFWWRRRNRTGRDAYKHRDI